MEQAPAPQALAGFFAAPDRHVRETSVVLLDGSTVRLLPDVDVDPQEVTLFYQGLSATALRFRFFAAATDFDRMTRLLLEEGATPRFGLVALSGADDQVVGHAMYRVTTDQRAEIAFAVADHAQGHGLGTLLLGALAEAANVRGIPTFEAMILPNNYQMLEMLKDSGFELSIHAGRDEITATFSTSPTGGTLSAYDLRDQTAAASALKHFFAPRSVAVIGASRRRGTVGGEVFHNLVSGDFAGPVYPVNLTATSVQSVAAFSTIGAIPGPVELAIIAAPHDQVEDLVEQCGRKGVSAVIVLSAGFGEAGGEGRERQKHLMAAVRELGLRIIGPNCLGIVNTDPAVHLNATFGPTTAPPGRVGFMSQSGALGLAAMDYARSLGLGISSFVSVGNKADISGNDLLCYWETDPRTDVILLYLESFGNPRKFSRIARRVGRSKPIIAVKSGRSAAGARAAGSHTGALLASSESSVDALFRQAGVIRVDTIEELFGAASLLASQPLPEGRRVAIVTNVGGPAILCADACEANGLELPALSELTQHVLKAILPEFAATGNPVDMIASATPEQYALAIPIVAADANVDAVIAIFVQPLATSPQEVALAIMDGLHHMPAHKPLLAVFMSGPEVLKALESEGKRVPVYAFPESAGIALAHAVRYAAWRQRPVEAATPIEGVRKAEAAAIVASALGQGAGWLQPEPARQLLDCYGIRCVAQVQAASLDEVGSLAAAFDGPYALKGLAEGVLHKTDLGLVKLALQSPADVANAAKAMIEEARSRGGTINGFIVQPMVRGIEMLAGVVHDPVFGPVVACGAGGVLVEVMKDFSTGLAPLSNQDASDMVQGLRSRVLLEGHRGSAPSDIAALTDVLLRLSALSEAFPQVAELDCNPLVVQEHGAVVVDVRVRITESDEQPRFGGRS